MLRARIVVRRSVTVAVALNAERIAHCGNGERDGALPVLVFGNEAAGGGKCDVHKGISAEVWKPPARVWMR